MIGTREANRNESSHKALIKVFSVIVSVVILTTGCSVSTEKEQDSSSVMTSSPKEEYLYSLDYMGTWYGFGTDGNEAQFVINIEKEGYDTANVRISGWGTNKKAATSYHKISFVSATKAEEVTDESIKRIFFFFKDKNGKQCIQIDFVNNAGKIVGQSMHVNRESILEEIIYMQEQRMDASSSKKEVFKQRYDELNQKTIPDAPQQEMNIASKNLFDEWDRLLNDVYAYLREIKPAEQFEVIKNDEIDWINEKEIAMENVRNEYMGGSMAPLMVNATAIEYTKERCRYLISLI